MESNKKLLKVLIVEDESIIAFSMKTMLSELGYDNCRIANTEDQANILMDSIHFGLIILDINLKHGEEGLKLARICHVKSIPFFYVSSYTDKATLDRAIETAPGAYIIKPFLPSNLYTAINLTLSTKEKSDKHFLTFKDGNDTFRIDSLEIIYLKAEGVYIKIVTANKKYLSRNSLKTLLKLLPEDDFTQTHRSFVINNNHITKYCTNHIELGKHSIPISRTFKPVIKEFE